MQTLRERDGIYDAQTCQTKGKRPMSRVKSANAVTKGGKLFLFGGFDEDDNRM